jgi:hypothetical protein
MQENCMAFFTEYSRSRSRSAIPMFCEGPVQLILFPATTIRKLSSIHDLLNTSPENTTSPGSNAIFVSSCIDSKKKPIKLAFGSPVTDSLRLGGEREAGSPTRCPGWTLSLPQDTDAGALSLRLEFKCDQRTGVKPPTGV